MVEKGGPTIVRAHLKDLAAAAPKDTEATKAKKGQERVKVTQER